MADAEPVLQASGLQKSFGDLKAVGGVDLTVAQGECLALLGPNGAGKTTTVEMLEGLTIPDAGRVQICGMDLFTQRAVIMEKVGVVLQETNLYKRFTVRETLELFASFFTQSREPDAIMSLLQLEEKADTRLMHLSGGQKQRVYLGCALLNDPQLLFLDEPTTGLDPQARRAIWDLLAEVKGQGRSILLTTHYMEEAAVLADRVAIIDKGRIIAEDTPQALVREICGEQTLRFATSGEVAQLADELPWVKDAQALEGGYEVVTSDPTAVAQDLFRAVERRGWDLQSLSMRECTLEDVFLKLTGRSMRDG